MYLVSLLLMAYKNELEKHSCAKIWFCLPIFLNWFFIMYHVGNLVFCSMLEMTCRLLLCIAMWSIYHPYLKVSLAEVKSHVIMYLNYCITETVTLSILIKILNHLFKIQKVKKNPTNIFYTWGYFWWKYYDS